MAYLWFEAPKSPDFVKIALCIHSLIMDVNELLKVKGNTIITVQLGDPLRAVVQLYERTGKSVQLTSSLETACTARFSS